MSGKWPQEHDDYLIRLWKNTVLLTNDMAAMINAKFEVFYTKNSIIGRAHRLHLTFADRPSGAKSAANAATGRRRNAAPKPPDRPQDLIDQTPPGGRPRVVFPGVPAPQHPAALASRPAPARSPAAAAPAPLAPAAKPREPWKPKPREPWKPRPPLASQDAPHSGPVGIESIEDGMCRWVVQIGPAKYCGRPCEKTYCLEHEPRPLRPSRGRQSKTRP
jgi:hypothetical protein